MPPRWQHRSIPGFAVAPPSLLELYRKLTTAEPLRKRRATGHPFPGVVPGWTIRGMDGPGESAEFEEADELQRLRRRAYGPNADIAGDAAAQARLSELEAAKRRERTPVVDAAAALPDPVSERVPVARPLEGSRPASTSVPQPVNGASPEREPDEGSVTERDPAGAPIPNSGPIDGALPARGGAAAARYPGSSPRSRCCPQPSASVSSSSMSRTSPHRSHISLRRANPRMRPFLPAMKSP